MKTCISLGLFFFLLWSCSVKNSKKNQANKHLDTTSATNYNQVESSTNHAFNLSFFQSIPDTIGCGDYYTFDTTKEQDDKYIFLSGMGEFAIISVGGETIYLAKDSNSSNKIDNREVFEVFKGNGYKITLHVMQTGTYGEGGFYKGSLIVEQGNRKKIISVHGQTGC